MDLTKPGLEYFRYLSSIDAEISDRDVQKGGKVD